MSFVKKAFKKVRDFVKKYWVQIVEMPDAEGAKADEEEID